MIKISKSEIRDTIKQFVQTAVGTQLNNEDCELICDRAVAQFQPNEITAVDLDGHSANVNIINIAAKPSVLSSEVVNGVSYDKLHMETIAVVVQNKTSFIAARSYDVYSREDDELFIQNDTIVSLSAVNINEYRFYK